MYEKGQLCTVYASDNVFLTVAGLSAAEIEGIYSFADYNNGDVIPLQNVKAFSRAIRLDFTEDNVVSLRVSLILRFGYTIPEVSSRLQEKVMSEIFNMIGCHVAFVNIRIADVRMA